MKFRIIEKKDGKSQILTLTREEVENVCTTSEMTAEEKEDACSKWLSENNAIPFSDMSFNEYQDQTAQTAIYPSKQALEYLCLGVASEAGEIAGKMKKLIRDEKGFSSEDWDRSLKAEIGDVLWYLARLADELNFSLSEIAEENIQKLLNRKNKGTLKGSGDDR